MYTSYVTISENSNPANCDTGTVTVMVDEPVRDGVNESAGPINGDSGSDAGIGVVDSDILNGVVGADADVAKFSTRAPGV